MIALDQRHTPAFNLKGKPHARKRCLLLWAARNTAIAADKAPESDLPSWATTFAAVLDPRRLQRTPEA